MDIGYFLIMSMSIIVGFGLSRFSQKKLQLPTWQRLGIAGGAFVGAMIGAKVPFLFDSWEGFLSGATWFSNGKTILTGLVGGYLGVEIAKWVLEVRTKTGDSFVVPVAAAIAIGRLGCFHAGCCFGAPTDLPWGIVFSTADSLRRHPTQIYEFIFHASAAVYFYWLADSMIFATHRIKLYIIAYATFRFTTEFIRPEAVLYWGLTGYQMCSLVIMALFAWLWWRDSRRDVANEIFEPTDLQVNQ